MLTNKFSGEEIKVIITYVLGNRASLDDDFCMFSFKKIDESLASMTPEDWEKYFPKDTRPKGWLNIEEHLPKMYAMDFAQGYSLFKVKYENGEIGESPVADHNTWYYRAKEAGITHWYNE